MEVRETLEVAAAEVEPNDSDVDLEAALERVRLLVGESDVEGARALARDLDQRWPDDKRVRYWARVLAPPEVRVATGERTRSLDPERNWFRQHAGEYPGCWLAVFGDRLIAADPDLAIVMKIVRETPGAEAAALFFVPPRSK